MPTISVLILMRQEKKKKVPILFLSWVPIVVKTEYIQITHGEYVATKVFLNFNLDLHIMENWIESII